MSLARLNTLVLCTSLIGPATAVTASWLEPSAAVQKDDRKAPKGYHFDTRYGFQFKQPRDWNRIPVKVSEEWLAAKYVSETEFHYYDKELGISYSHNPEVSVIVFPDEVMKKKSKAAKSEDGDEITITINNPYKDYDDFLDRTYAGGGFFKSAEEEDEIDGVKVTKLTYKVTKITRNGPQTISTWIYHADDADYAVQLIGLTDHMKKVEKEAKPIRQTFELIERDGPLTHSGATADVFTFTRVRKADETPKERRTMAKDSEKVMHEKAIAKLPPDGWEYSDDGRSLVLYSAEKRWANRVEKHAENLFDWLDDNFGFLGEDAYMRRPIVRICKDIDEAQAYASGVRAGGSGGGWILSEEIVTWKDSGGWTGYVVDYLNNNLYRYWMLEKNFALSSAMPEWIDVGLRTLVENARMDGRKVDWRYDVGLVNYMRDAIRKEKVIPMQDLFLMTSKEFREAFEDDPRANPWAAGASVIHYLASPEVRRHRRANDLLEDYLRNMMKVVEEVDKETEKELEAAREAASDAEGEGEYLSLRRSIYAKKEKELLQRTFDMTFGDWEERDWEQLNEHFQDAF